MPTSWHKSGSVHLFRPIRKSCTYVSFGRLGVEGSVFIDQLAASDRFRGGEGLMERGKGCWPRAVYYFADDSVGDHPGHHQIHHYLSDGGVPRFKFQLRDYQETTRSSADGVGGGWPTYSQPWLGDGACNKKCTSHGYRGHSQIAKQLVIITRLAYCTGHLQ